MTPSQKLILTLEGVNSILDLYEDRLVVHFKGLASGILPLIPLKDCSVSLDEIQNVQFYANRFLINGLIKFIVKNADSIWFVYNGRRYTEAKAFVKQLQDLKACRQLSSPMTSKADVYT